MFSAFFAVTELIMQINYCYMLQSYNQSCLLMQL